MSGISKGQRNVVVQALKNIFQAFVAAVGRLDKSFSPSVNLNRLRKHTFTVSDLIYLFHIALATFWLTIMEAPGFPLKLIIPILYTIALLIPFTSQFFIPATPVFAWLLTFYTSRFIPNQWRPAISVSLLPTLEYVLYGANISDILTRFTHPILDIIAWMPYGVGHYLIPIPLAILLWLFRSKEVLHLWGRVFGYMNLTAVITQIVFPCSAPWYELIYGLTPATYAVRGSPGGLARIDAIFHSSGYKMAFNNSPLVFGAFPSLHAGWATLEALFISHFFPDKTRYVWGYAGVLYWSTMYLTHHYLIDVVGGACLATVFFYLFMPDELKGEGALAPPGGLINHRMGSQRSKYEIYDLEDPRGRSVLNAADFELSDASSDEAEVDITYRSPIPGATPTSANINISIPKNVAGQRPHDGVEGNGAGQARKSHRHTASIASLIRGEERSAEDGWSPVGAGFTFPQRNGGGEDANNSSRR
jgi:membrane-associated phospholipid phosphatase